jgi:hypothetical protein
VDLDVVHFMQKLAAVRIHHPRVPGLVLCLLQISEGAIARPLN